MRSDAPQVIMDSDFDSWRSVAAAADAMAMALAPPSTLAAVRRRRLAALLASARLRTRLYAERLRGLPDDAPLHTLPVLDKAEWMARFDDGVADPAVTLAAVRAHAADPARIGQPLLGRYAVWESSGSSGRPGLFVQDVGALAVYDALEALRPLALDPLGAWRLAGPWGGAGAGLRMAFVVAVEGHFASHASVQRLRRLNPLLAPALRSFSILQPLPCLLEALNDWQPRILATYPTAAALLAGEQRRGRLRLALREVRTGGETLGPGQRKAIEAGFGCPLRNSYGASEFLAMAAECARGRLHLNADWVILEPVDRHGRPVPPGTLSHGARLTNLANHVQPLIRYELGDRIRVGAEPCPCGSPLPVIEVLGRHDDALCLSGADGRPVALLPLAIASVMEDEAGVFDFQLCQHDARTLRLRLGAGEEARRARCHQVLQRHALAQGVRGLRIVDEPGRPPQRGRSGKVQRVVRPATAPTIGPP
jgi:phenylacetate-coenzyme A ligase PaaK-like adenylate-forming protein